MLRKSLVVLYITIIFGGFGDTVFSNSRIFLDIGVVGSLSKTKESNKCYDLGLKAKMTDDIFLKSDDEEAVLHKCSDLCDMDEQKIDNKGSYGARFGIYKQVDKFFAIGLDIFSEWYNVEYNDDSGYKFQCTGDSCQKRVRYSKFYIDDDGKLQDNGSDTESCCNLFNSKRFSTCNPFFKTSKRQQIGGLVSLKLYTNSRASFVKFGVGVGQLKRRIPVAIPHEACTNNPCAHNDEEGCLIKASAQHAFKIENVSAKKGLAFGISFGTKVSQNVFFGVDFLTQQNKNKENTETYKNRKIGVSLSMELGR